MTRPLEALTEKGKPHKVVWSRECNEALEMLKKCFATEPILILPDLNKEFIIRCDASSVGIGGILLQTRDDILMPCAYVSRKLSDSEKNYQITERECLAVIFTVKKFERYLLMNHFVIEMNHEPLLVLRKSKDAHGRVMRWALLLQQFSFSIRAISGAENHHGDVLSRLVENYLDGDDSRILNTRL